MACPSDTSLKPACRRLLHAYNRLRQHERGGAQPPSSRAVRFKTVGEQPASGLAERREVIDEKLDSGLLAADGHSGQDTLRQVTLDEKLRGGGMRNNNKHS